MNRALTLIAITAIAIAALTGCASAGSPDAGNVTAASGPAPAVVFHVAADTYSATCVVDYSDGTSAEGTGNLVVSADKVTFEPVS